MLAKSPFGEDISIGPEGCKSQRIEALKDRGPEEVAKEDALIMIANLEKALEGSRQGFIGYFVLGCKEMLTLDRMKYEYFTAELCIPSHPDEEAYLLEDGEAVKAWSNHILYRSVLNMDEQNGKAYDVLFSLKPNLAPAEIGHIAVHSPQSTL
jgi:hypothetical protein